MSRVTAASKGLASCHLCLKVASVELNKCPRCGTVLHSRKSNSLNRTLALLCTATILYIPANISPIMVTDQLGSSIESTILGGVVLLIQMDSIPVAAIIFIASVMVPVKSGSSVSPRQRTIAYRITELIGKWSMIDVFVVSILVALVQVGKVLVIRPGIASITFAALVIVTMIAAEEFDSRLFWDNEEGNHD
jgi:paraquat-inducible protein A